MWTLVSGELINLAMCQRIYVRQATLMVVMQNGDFKELSKHDNGDEAKWALTRLMERLNRVTRAARSG